MEKHSQEEAQTVRKSEQRRLQAREKVGKSRNAVFFQCFVAPEGRKVGSLKRRVQSQLARGEMQKRTRQAHLEVKMHNHTMFGPPLEVAMWEKCTRLWHEAHLEVKMCKA